jgi:hypothetical protein
MCQGLLLNLKPVLHPPQSLLVSFNRDIFLSNNSNESVVLARYYT